MSTFKLHQMQSRMKEPLNCLWVHRRQVVLLPRQSPFIAACVCKASCKRGDSKLYWRQWDFEWILSKFNIQVSSNASESFAMKLSSRGMFISEMFIFGALSKLSEDFLPRSPKTVNNEIIHTCPGFFAWSTDINFDCSVVFGTRIDQQKFHLSANIPTTTMDCQCTCYQALTNYTKTRIDI